MEINSQVSTCTREALKHNYPETYLFFFFVKATQHSFIPVLFGFLKGTNYEPVQNAR